MKLLIMASSLIAFSAFAMMGDLGEMKKDASESIGKEITSLQSSRTCINGAKTVESFKACNYDSGHMDMQKEEAMMDKKMDKKMDHMKDNTMQKKEEVMDKKEDLDTID
jgi:hypothetical protein